MLGLVYTEKGEFQQALDYFDNALDLFKREQLFSSQTEIIKNKGAVYLKQGDYALANELFEDAFNRSKQIRYGICSCGIKLIKCTCIAWS